MVHLRRHSNPFGKRSITPAPNAPDPVHGCWFLNADNALLMQAARDFTVLERLDVSRGHRCGAIPSFHPGAKSV